MLQAKERSTVPQAKTCRHPTRQWSHRHSSRLLPCLRRHRSRRCSRHCACCAMETLSLVRTRSRRAGGCAGVMQPACVLLLLLLLLLRRRRRFLLLPLVTGQASECLLVLVLPMLLGLLRLVRVVVVVMVVVAVVVAVLALALNCGAAQLRVRVSCMPPDKRRCAR